MGDQAHYARTVYGLRVINSNWKDFLKNTSLQKEHYGTFDAVTFMDTVEHYISNVDVAPLVGDKACEDGHQTYYDMFEMASKMMKPNSPRKRVFISMLHATDRASKLPFPLSLYV